MRISMKHCFYRYSDNVEMLETESFSWGIKQPGSSPAQKCVTYVFGYELYDSPCSAKFSTVCKVIGYVKFEMDGICKEHFLLLILNNKKFFIISESFFLKNVSFSPLL